MLGIQFMESAIYAIYHALAVVLIESIAAYSLTGVWINWNEIGSLFYSQTGAVADAGFLGVAITVFFEIYDSVWFFGFIILESQIYVYRMDFADRTGRNRSFGKYRFLSNFFGFVWRVEFSEDNFCSDIGWNRDNWRRVFGRCSENQETRHFLADEIGGVNHVFRSETYQQTNWHG